jgi:hypothetical protein
MSDGCPRRPTSGTCSKTRHATPASSTNRRTRPDSARAVLLASSRWGATSGVRKGQKKSPIVPQESGGVSRNQSIFRSRSMRSVATLEKRSQVNTRRGPVDTRSLLNKFKGLRALHAGFAQSAHRSGDRRAARRHLWARSMEAGERSAAVEQSGRSTTCSRLPKSDAGQSNVEWTIETASRRGVSRQIGARRAVGPHSCCSGECTRRGRMDTGPDSGAFGPPAFLL